MEELKRLRTERGWSQQKLADASGVNKATINQVEQGKRSPSIQTLESLARAMGAEVGDFFPKAQAPLWSGEGPERRSELPPVAAFLHAQMGARLADVWGPELEEREEAGDLQWMMRVAGIMDDYGKVFNELLKNTTFPDKETAETIAFMAMDLNAFFARTQEAMPRVKEARESEVEARERAHR